MGLRAPWARAEEYRSPAKELPFAECGGASLCELPIESLSPRVAVAQNNPERKRLLNHSRAWEQGPQTVPPRGWDLPDARSQTEHVAHCCPCSRLSSRRTRSPCCSRCR